MIRMYAREWAQRALNEGLESLLLGTAVIAGVWTGAVIATVIAGALLLVRGALRWWDALRLFKGIAYVDLTVVPTGNHVGRRPPPRKREYVN